MKTKKERFSFNKTSGVADHISCNYFATVSTDNGGEINDTNAKCKLSSSRKKVKLLIQFFEPFGRSRFAEVGHPGPLELLDKT